MKINMQTVFDSFAEECQDQAKLHALKTVLKHLCKACEVEESQEIGIDRFWDLERTFKKYLMSPEANLSTKSQREYRHRLGLLLTHARQKGIYSQTEPDISPEWKIAAEEAREKIHHVAYWAIMKFGKFASIRSCGLSGCDKKIFEAYYIHLCSPEGGVKQVKIAYDRVKRALMQLYPDDFPESRFYIIPSKVNASFMLPMSQWNPELRRIGEAYIYWHTARYVKGRPKKCRQKKITNDNNVRRLERYVGFLHNKLGIPIEEIDLDVFMDYENVLKYIDYLDDVNGANGAHQKSYLAIFRSMACNFIPLALDRECGDKDALIEIHSEYMAIPRWRPENFAERYAEVVVLADEIMKQRKKYEAKNKKAARNGNVEISERTIASMYMKELLVRLALRRPLRSRNFSELLVGQNLIVKNNQYMLRYTDTEIKTGRHLGFVEFPFPKPVVPLLETYLVYQRPKLQNGTACQNLFLSRVGTPINKHQIRKIFLDWSERIYQAHLTTHHIRHIAATGYLKRHPGDFLTLQKMLMHRRLETTIRIYGQFNEAHASVHFDEFADTVEAEVNIEISAPKKRNRKAEQMKTKAMEIVLRIEDERL